MTRNRVLKVRFTEAERLLISERTKEHGYSAASRYVREKALGVTRSGPKEMELRGLIRTANTLQSMALSLSNTHTRVLAREVRDVLFAVKEFLLERHHGNR